jgi:hypothetical protein
LPQGFGERARLALAITLAAKTTSRAAREWWSADISVSKPSTSEPPPISAADQCRVEKSALSIGLTASS